MNDSPDVTLVLCTAGSPEEGEKIGTALVERGQAACVNVLPGLTSIYHWEGKLCRESEVLLLVKTLASRLPDVVSTVRELHSYQVPEVIAVPVTGGLAEYLIWVAAECGRQDPGKENG